MQKISTFFVLLLSCAGVFAYENGILPGLFTVHSNGMQVRFSQGNLQYSAAGTHIADDGNELAGTWQFAARQYESLGIQPKDGWRDLFHWASSGYKGVGPDYDVRDNSKYGDGKNQIAKSWWDWGWYNPITNGGNQTRMWRTLTKVEWDYLYLSRPNANKLRGQATVCGMYGFIVLPDNWTDVQGVTPFVSDADGIPCEWTVNIFDEGDWAKMEIAGAVFFPVSIKKVHTDESVTFYGGYWNASPVNEYASYWTFQDCSFNNGEYPRYYDANVRLVVDVMAPSAIYNHATPQPGNKRQTTKFLSNGQLLLTLPTGETYNAIGIKIQ